VPQNDIHVPDFLVSLWNQRYWWLAVISGVAGTFWWWLSKMFATRNQMEKCRVQMDNDFNIALIKHEEREIAHFKEYKKQDLDLHERLLEDVRGLRRALDELTRKLIP